MFPYPPWPDTITVVTESGSSNWWTEWGASVFGVVGPLLGLVGVLVGAWLGARLRESTDTGIELRREMRQAFYESLQVAYELRSAYKELTSSMSGATGTPEEDAATVKAMDRAGRAYDDTDRMKSKLHIVSGRQTAEEFAALTARCQQYGRDLLRQLAHGKFEGAAADAFLKDLDRLINKYADHLADQLNGKKPKRGRSPSASTNASTSPADPAAP